MTWLRRLIQSVIRLIHSILRWPRLLVKSMTRAVTRMIRGVFRFPAAVLSSATGLMRYGVNRWIKATRARDLVFGLPALIAVVTFIALSLIALRGDASRRVDMYDVAARQAVSRGDYAAAKLYLKRVLQTGADRPDTRFMLGKLAIENGDTETANVLLSDLAPVDQPVQYEAHLWRAQQLLSRGTLSVGELVEAESQLINASLLRRNDNSANSLLGQLYHQTQRYPEARTHFLRVDPRGPTDELYLAEVHRALGETAMATAAAERAQQSFANRVERRPRDLESLLKLSASLRFLQQFAEADRVLRSNSLLADEPALQTERVVNLISWYDTIAAEPANLRRRLQILRTALQIHPREPLIYDRMLQLLLSEGDGSDVVRQSLQRQLAQGTAPALIHLLLGIDASSRKEDSAAVYHYRAALRSDPKMTVAANNLAWSLLAIDPPRIEEAEAISQQLCKLHPEIAAFQETRGQVLLKAKKYEQALEAFDLAIGELAHEPSIHRGMAEAYQAIGLAELAASHQQWLKQANQQQKNDPDN